MDLPFKEDKNGNGYVTYNGRGCFILNITSVSPDDSTRSKYFAAAFPPVRPVNFDQDGRDGWAVAWDTSTVNDGFYLVRATMQDDRGNLGRDTVEVLVDNSVPQVQLQAQDRQGGSVMLIASETTGSEDVEFMTFSYSRDGGDWTVIGTDSEGSDGWGILWDASRLPPGSCILRAQTTDWAGNDAATLQNITLQPH
jgi:hypothetical protein